MTASDFGQPAARPRRGGKGVFVGAVLIVLVGVGLLAYVARGPIAERLARNWFTQNGVTSSLKVQAVSLTGLTASLRLGDQADPDLTVERLEVGYGFAGPWDGRPLGVETRSLRLVHPRLKLNLTAGGLNSGALQPLINAALKQPSRGGPLLDIIIQDGTVLLATPDGPVRFRGGGELRGGTLTALNGEFAPFAAAIFGVHVTSRGGGLQLSRRGDRLLATAYFGPAGLAEGPTQISATRISLSGELPASSKGGRWVGLARLALVARGVSGNVEGLRAAGGTANIDLSGELDARPTRQALVGRLLISSQFASAGDQAVQAHDVTARLDLKPLAFARAPAILTLSGAGNANLTMRSATMQGAALSNLASTTRVESFGIRAGGGRATAAATLEGELGASGAFAAASARRLAQAIPVLSGQASYAAAMERGLRAYHFSAPLWRAEVSDQGTNLTLASSTRIDTGSGAHLTLGGTATSLTLRPKSIALSTRLTLGGGGTPPLQVQLSNGSISQSGFDADIAAQGVLDALFARGAHVQLKGHLAGAGPSLHFNLAGCAPVSAQRLAFDPNSVTTFSATLCPGLGPLIDVSPVGWKVDGRLRNAQGDVANVQAKLRKANGDFQVQGHAGQNTVRLALDHAEVVDAANPIRFRPLGVAGRAGLIGGDWAGNFTAVTRAARPIATVRLRHHVATGAGRLDIDARALLFAPGALQPADLTPLANFARDTEGPARFKGWFAWGGGGTTSGGELVAKGLKFKSPVGSVFGIDADLHFTGLSPLVTAPDQTIAVGLVQAVTPLSGLSAQFDLNGGTVMIDTASAALAKGHIHLEQTVASLAAGSTLNGVLVLDHVNLGEILAASSLADAVKMDAVVDGRIPFELGPSGLTIRQGRLAAVSPGRLSISRKALSGGASAHPTAAPPSSKDPTAKTGFAEDLAYQAMDNLAFDQLDASVNSLPGERLGIIFHIKGRHDPPHPQRAVISLNDLVHGQAFAKPITLPSDTRIDLTLDTSLNFGQLVRALAQAWRDTTSDSETQGRSAPVQSEKPLVKRN
jgi:hypothetical protein